jgi:hypothetical protein
MILANQFVPGILTDGAELVVDVGNGALSIGDSHHSVLIQSKFLIRDFFECSLAGGRAFLHGLLSPLAVRDVAPNV